MGLLTCDAVVQDGNGNKQAMTTLIKDKLLYCVAIIAAWIWQTAPAGGDIGVANRLS